MITILQIREVIQGFTFMTSVDEQSEKEGVNLNLQTDKIFFFF